MNNILVTGGSGQIGSELKSLKNKNGYKFFFPNSKELDISKKKSVSNYLNKNRIDLVLNCAAYTNVDKAEKQKRLAKEVNYIGALNLSTETVKRDIGLIHFSTDYVFGKNSKGINSYNNKVSPINYYGYTKALGEGAVLDNSHLGMVVRLASVYGIYGNNFIKTISKSLLTSNEIEVVNDQKISLTGSYELVLNIGYLIDLYKKKIKKQSFKPKIIHFTNKGYTNWFKVACIIKEEIELIIKERLDVNLIPIKSLDWKSLAERPLDSRLKVLHRDLEKNKIILPNWEISVRNFVRKIFPNTKREITND
tara:strand:- start:781 stop:1704 length:924 start_codon:yes stop_codon:yes gene_type:complete